jgi:hypothetical protein
MKACAGCGNPTRYTYCQPCRQEREAGLKEWEVRPHFLFIERQCREKYPERYAARRAVERALKRGDLVKQPCRDCGSPNVQAHHEDYNRPLEVVWLCRKHHAQADKAMRIRETGQISLLDTMPIAAD